jgi:hypothetical protein
LPTHRDDPTEAILVALFAEDVVASDLVGKRQGSPLPAEIHPTGGVQAILAAFGRIDAMKSDTGVLDLERVAVHDGPRPTISAVADEAKAINAAYPTVARMVLT